MNTFANEIHKRYRKGCLEMIDKAVKLSLSIDDMLFILFCFNQAFKAPFLISEEYYTYAKTLPFGDIMEELFVARDTISKKMSNELIKLESYFSIWSKDACKE